MDFCNKTHENNHKIDIVIYQFISKLGKNGQTADWKITQAQTAVKLYVYHFLKGDISSLFPDRSDNLQKKSFDIIDIVKKTREIIRIKHYSYRTECAYVDWIKRYFNYVAETKGSNIHQSELDSSGLKDYISYLAIRKKVSSSTQNQAFNALLFLYKNNLAFLTRS